MKRIGAAFGLSVVLACLPAAVTEAAYEYEPVEQLITTGNLVDVAWHPDGGYALLLESGGLVLRVDAADWSVSQVAALDGFRPRRLAFAPDGGEALIVGHFVSGQVDEGRVYRWDHSAETLEPLADCAEPGVPLWAVDFTADGALALVVGWYQINNAGGALLAYHYDPESRSLATAAATNAWGPTDASWRPDAEEALITIGTNDAEVLAYRPAAADPNKLLETDYRWTGSNARAVEHHPQLGFGVVVDGHQNALQWDWGWSKVDLNASLVGVAFNSDGSRALLVGRTRPAGGGLVGTVVEYRGVQGAFTAADFSDVSIPGFGAAPWGADSSTYLNAVAFRPGRCEGLLVGQQGAGAAMPFAPIVRFTDIRGADCLDDETDGGPTDGGLPDGGPLDGGDNPADGGDSPVDGDGGAAVIPCQTDADCPAGQHCSQNRCTAECGDDSDCIAPLVCDDRGRCVQPQPDGGAADAGSDGGGDGSTGADGGDGGADAAGDGGGCTGCRYDSDCPAGRYCRDGCCVADCFLDTDCPAGFHCGPSGRCRAVNEPISSCACGSAPGGPAGCAGLLLGLIWLARRRRG
jgi:Cys-rich repeat protein